MKVLRAAACFGFAWLLVFRAGELRAQAQDPNESFQPPWAEGDVLVADWRVVGLVSHPEFLRYRFSRGEGDGLEMAYVEINRRSGPDAQFTTERYEVQPSPEGFAPRHRCPLPL